MDVPAWRRWAVVMPKQRLSAQGAAQESPMRKRAAMYDFGLILLLIFGGCCSNALALELTTRQLPASGTLLTLAQFVATTLIALLGELEWRSVYGWPVLWLRRPGVPLRRWLIQVVLYFITSILNNEAFAFHIPMSVHIVFRSGGMLVNMILGYTVSGKRYSLLQLASVMLVTVGVIVATLSAAMPSASGPPSRHPMGDYMTGVTLLSLALITSGCMGLFQEQTYAKYGREHWHEALFYSHLFSLPLFVLQSGALRQQIAHANQTPREWIGMCKSCEVLGFYIPSYYTKLALNILTQLLCINGVNRLTSRVSSLSVSLILVVRKAVSLLISVVLLNHQTGSMGLWSGAAAVLVGTLGYSYGGLRRSTPSPKVKST